MLWNSIVRGYKTNGSRPSLTRATVLHSIRESYIYRTPWTLCMNRSHSCFSWFRPAVFQLMLSIVAVIKCIIWSINIGLKKSVQMLIVGCRCKKTERNHRSQNYGWAGFEDFKKWVDLWPTLPTCVTALVCLYVYCMCMRILNVWVRPWYELIKIILHLSKLL